MIVCADDVWIVRLQHIRNGHIKLIHCLHSVHVYVLPFRWSGDDNGVKDMPIPNLDGFCL